MENEELNELEGDAAREQPASFQTPDQENTSTVRAHAPEAFAGSAAGSLAGTPADSASSENEAGTAQEPVGLEEEAAWEHFESPCGNLLESLGLVESAAESDASASDHPEPAAEPVEQNEGEPAQVDSDAGDGPDSLVLVIGDAENSSSDSAWEITATVDNPPADGLADSGKSELSPSEIDALCAHSEPFPEHAHLEPSNEDGPSPIQVESCAEESTHAAEALESHSGGGPSIRFAAKELSPGEPPAEFTGLDEGQNVDPQSASEGTTPELYADLDHPDWWEEPEIDGENTEDAEAIEKLRSLLGAMEEAAAHEADPAQVEPAESHAEDHAAFEPEPVDVWDEGPASLAEPWDEDVAAPADAWTQDPAAPAEAWTEEASAPDDVWGEDAASPSESWDEEVPAPAKAWSEESSSPEEPWNEESPTPAEAWTEEGSAHDLDPAHSEWNGAEDAEAGLYSQSELEVNTGTPESLSWSVPAGFDPSTLEVRRIEPETTGGDLVVTYGFVVRNTAPVPLSHVRVEHELPEGARCIGVLPRPEVSGGTLIWRLGTMAAGAEERFLVRVQKGQAFELPAEATATLHACYFLKAPVARPRLLVTVTGPERVQVRETAVFEVEVKNQGTAPATNLVLRDQIGPCFEHTGGADLELKLGTLAPGASIVAKITAIGARGGKQTSAITISCAENVLATGECEVVVTQPILELYCTKPSRAWVGRSVRFTIDVSNRGTAPIGQSLLVNTLPEELEFLWASDVGEFDPSDRSITWILGTLEPGHSRAFIVEVTPKTPGEHPHHTLAWTDCGLEAHADSALDAQIDQSLSSRLLDQLLAAVDEEDKEATSQTQAEIRPNVVSPAPGARGSQYVVFSMSDGDYAIPLENVLEYGHPLKVTPVPNVPEWVLGVANVHGDIVSMVDLRLFLGQDPHGFDEDGRLLVVRSRKEDITVGLIVDRVKGIHVVADEHILQPSSRAEDHLATYVRGVASHHGRLIVLLSLDQLLLSSEMRQFEPV